MAGVKENTLTNISSGNVASFKSVGSVPLKSLKVNFNPIQEGEGYPSPDNVRPITGWTGINLYHSGKNLWNNEDVIYGYWTNVSGEQTVNTSGCRTKDIYIIPNTTIKIFYYGVQPYSASIIELNANKEFIKRTHMGWYGYPKPSVLTITTTNETKYIYAQTYVVGNNGIMTYDFLCSCKIQMEFNFQTEYEPFKQLNIVPIDWTDNGTIYGGYVNLITNELVATWYKYIFTGEEQISEYSGTYRSVNLLATYPPEPNIKTNAICTHATYNAYGSQTQTRFSLTDGGTIYFRSSFTVLYPTVEEFIAFLKTSYITGHPVEIVYPLATPISYSLNDISITTLIGTNNIWSTADTIEAEYYFLESLDIYKQRFKANEPHLETATGNIANFNTDMVAPLKDCKVYFKPVQAAGTPSPDNVIPISGWNNLKVYRTSKNIRNWTITDTTIPLDYNGGTGNFNGFGNNYWDNYWAIPESLCGKTITYSVEIVRAENPTNEYAEVRCWTYTSSGTYIQLFTPPSSQRYQTGSGRSTITFTVPENTGRLGLGILAGRGDRVYNPIVSIGSTAIKYETYNGSTTSITLPSTYYGGYIDLTSGEGYITHILMSDTWGNWGTVQDQGDGTELRYKKFPYPVKGNGLSNFNIPPICNVAPYNYNNNTGNTHFYIVGNSYNCRIYLPSGTDTNLQIQAIGELITPIPFTLTPVQLKTLKNQNNIWSNTNGITEVKYWTHGSIADKRKVIWNNLVNGYLSAEDWKDRSSSDTTTTFEDGIATTTFLASQGSYRTMCTINSHPTYNEHKYYSRIQCAVNNTVFIGADAANIAWALPMNVDVNEWGTYSHIVAGKQDRNSTTYCPRLSANPFPEGTIAKTKNVFEVDLTLMFGAGNEPTKEEFEILCVKNGIDLNKAYPYNEGTEMYWYF